MQLKKHLQLAMLLTLAIIISIIESFAPLLGGVIPGFKLGLANVVVVFALFVFSAKEAIYISLAKVFLVAILRTGLFSVTFFFSLFGAVLSVLVMILLKKLNKLSIVGISVAGAVFHGLGQLVFASLLFSTWQIMNYFPIIVLLAIPSGIIVGFLAKTLVLHYQEDLQ